MSQAVTSDHSRDLPGIGAEPGPPEGLPTATVPTRGRSLLRRFLGATLLLSGAVGAGYLAWTYPAEAERAWEYVAGKPRAKGAATTPHRPSRLARAWDGTITLPQSARAHLGLTTAEALPQTEPIRLELLGSTDYITDTLTKIRPMFKGRVDKVHVALNQAVKKGDPLIDLYSTDLAEAKRAYEIEHIQWVYDLNLLKTREPLMKSKAIAQQLFEETKNNEMKSRREYEVARDKLFVYGLSAAEIQAVESEPGTEKARLTIRSPADGFVIDRDAAPGNLYDENDVLLTIAPLDRLWVWGNVFESDLDLVRLGQAWEIRFPYLEPKLQGRVEYISNRVDPATHAVRVRTSIPNLEGRLKSAMLVRGMLEIPPDARRVVIPRTAMIVDDGHYYAFVRTGTGEPASFERRTIAVAQEKDDHVVVDHGLKAGESVVTVGALILAQIYEDQKIAQTAEPAARRGPSTD